MYLLKNHIVEVCEYNDLTVEFADSDDILALRKKAETTFDLMLGGTFFNYDIPGSVTERDNPWIYRYLFELFWGRPAILFIEAHVAPIGRAYVFQYGPQLCDLLNVMPPFAFFATTPELDVAVLDGNDGYITVFGERTDWLSSVKARVESLGFEWE